MRLNPVVQALFLAAMFAPALSVPASEPPPLLLAGIEQGQADVALYLISEKIDGVRALWDGQALRTRSGNIINSPRWFTENFPPHALDGELWIARGKFDQLSATVRRQTPDDGQWRQVRYLVFELPQAPGSFRERAQALKAIVAASGVRWLQAVEQFELASREALANKLDEILKLGGEGLMLHRADALYTTGRSDVLLKMKLWHDAEAMVVGYQPGRGKYAGMLGALRVRSADGVEFLLGTGLSEADRRDPPPIGTLVTFRYRELNSRGIPRFASFYRVRND
ncbi:MAG: dependent ligase [Proteobacteria bacterium]|nr:dependent ligase [Pseudomonadota bacterium]